MIAYNYFTTKKYDKEASPIFLFLATYSHNQTHDAYKY